MTVTVGGLVEHVPAALHPTLDGDGSVGVVDVTHDSRAVVPGSMFVCFVGEHHDGHDHAADAVRAGAGSLLVERRLPDAATASVPTIVVTDTRLAAGYVAGAVHGDPSRSLRVVGITGTNGKTTTTQLVASIAGAAGHRAGTIGTLSGARTTPEAPDLQRRLAGFRDDGVDTVVMEVSSHALALHRVDGTHVEVGVFTNLGRDHLDLHGSLEEYFRAKARLFTPELAAVGVTNVDDPYGRLLLDAATIEMVPFSRDDASDVEVGVAHHSFEWRGRRFRVPLGGGFNVMNSLAALTVSAVLDIDPEVAAHGLATVDPVPGRFDVVAVGGVDAPFTVVVDYAHTPDGLRELLAAARGVAGDGRVVVVFGCGGDRDREKRGPMGAAAHAGADLVVVTSDNPRHEEPLEIIEAVVAGIPAGYRDTLAIEPDRRAAIALALGEARTGDVVVIAGKGHETTQTIGATAHPFDDRVVARELVQELS